MYARSLQLLDRPTRSNGLNDTTFDVSNKTATHVREARSLLKENLTTKVMSCYGKCEAATWIKGSSSVSALEPCTCECDDTKTTAYSNRSKAGSKQGSLSWVEANSKYQEPELAYQFPEHSGANSTLDKYSSVNEDMASIKKA